MAESNTDRIDSQKERIHAMEVAISLKPNITLAEYLKYEEKLLAELQKK